MVVEKELLNIEIDPRDVDVMQLAIKNRCLSHFTGNASVEGNVISVELKKGATRQDRCVAISLIKKDVRYLTGRC